MADHLEEIPSNQDPHHFDFDLDRRQNISIAEMKCRYLTFDSEWWVFAAEFALMVHFRPQWNQSGFGSKTPGRGRPGTHRISRWNELSPPLE